MAADATTLTEKMRAALRISSTSEKITAEIEDCIAACKADLANDGVKAIDCYSLVYLNQNPQFFSKLNKVWDILI